MAKAKLILNCFMVCLYAGIGLFCLLVNVERIQTNPAIFRLFGILVLAYSLFRAVRTYQIFKSEK